MSKSAFYAFIFGFVITSCQKPCTKIGCTDGLDIRVHTSEETLVEITLKGRTGQVERINCGGDSDNCPETIGFDAFEVQQMDVRLSSDSVTVKSYSEDIIYNDITPNGKHCEPECRQAITSIVES